MKVEAGKHYMTRDNKEVGPMIERDSRIPTRYPFVCGRTGATYTRDGKIMDTSLMLDNDIVSEAAPSNPISFEDASDEDYAILAAILHDAHDQAATGKGRERHANGRPFERQPILEIGRMTGPGGPIFQSIKKQQEALGMFARGETEAAIRELLGAINYTASAVLVMREAE